MQPDERDAAYLWDMLEAAREVVDMLDGCELQSFLHDRLRTRAIERTIEMLGEAARRVSDSYMQVHEDIPWRQIIGQRNILAHEYGQIDHELLFKTATSDIPALIALLEIKLSLFE